MVAEDLTAPFYAAWANSPALIKVLIFFFIIGIFVSGISAILGVLGICDKIDLQSAITGDYSAQVPNVQSNVTFSLLPGAQILRGAAPACSICYISGLTSAVAPKSVLLGSGDACIRASADFVLLENGNYTTYKNQSCFVAFKLPGIKAAMIKMIDTCAVMKDGASRDVLYLYTNRTAGLFEPSLRLNRRGTGLSDPYSCTLEYYKTASFGQDTMLTSPSVLLSSDPVTMAGGNACDAKPGFKLFDYRIFLTLGVASFLCQFALIVYQAMAGFRQV
jgi:hypothetical protein